MSTKFVVQERISGNWASLLDCKTKEEAIKLASEILIVNSRQTRVIKEVSKTAWQSKSPT